MQANFHHICIGLSSFVMESTIYSFKALNICELILTFLLNFVKFSQDKVAQDYNFFLLSEKIILIIYQDIMINIILTFPCRAYLCYMQWEAL